MQPKTADQLADQALQWLQAEDPRRALEAAGRALAQDPDHVVAFRLQAACLVELKHPDAERQARALVQREPDTAYSHRVMCRLFRKCLNNPVMAVRAAARACELDPHDDMCHVELAASLSECGDRRAIDEARRAVALAPNELSNRVLLMAVLNQFDHNAEAAHLADQILVEDPGNAAAMLIKGDTQLNKSWGAHALGWWGRALAADPTQGEIGVRTAMDHMLSVWGHRMVLLTLLGAFLTQMIGLAAGFRWLGPIVVVLLVAWLGRLWNQLPKAQHRFIRRYPVRQPLRVLQWLVCLTVWIVLLIAPWLPGDDQFAAQGLAIFSCVIGSWMGMIPVRQQV